MEKKLQMLKFKILHKLVRSMRKWFHNLLLRKSKKLKK
jgi:hypothetical protein